MLKGAIDGSDEPRGPGRNGEKNFRNEKRSNDTHASSIAPDAKLDRKGNGHETRLCFIGHTLMVNSSGLIVEDFEQLLRSIRFWFDTSGRLLDGEKDLSEVISDWPKLMQDIAPSLKRWFRRSFNEDDGKLVGVRIEGQRATATILTRNGSTKQKGARFIKEQSGWCLLEPQ